MKLLYKFWLLFVTVCSAWTLQAAPVDSLTVARVATAYLSQYVDRFEGLECVVKRTTDNGTALYYVFNHKNNNGFIMVTADDACFPILGYATTGNFSPDNVPPQLNKLLFQRAAEISFIKREKFTATAEIRQFWQRLKNPSPTARTGKIQAVGPLLTTTWNQSPYYNDLCPDSSGYKAVTGCVATAMAQIMKYHNYPKTGQGYHTYTSKDFGQRTVNFGATTYNWESMPNALTRQSTASAVSAVATLMYHCGVSVEMDYGIKSSGIPSTSIVADVYKKYFGYGATVKYVRKADYATESAWIAMLKAELDSKRPVEYGGIGSESGHEFVCDGYNNDNLFHFNWGWGGLANEYYYVSALNPTAVGIGGGLGEYNDLQDAIIGIQPDTTVSKFYDLQLNKKLTVSPNPITFGNDVTVSFNIVNKGTATFKGDYSVALFTDEGDFITDIGKTKTNFSLPANNRYIDDLTFTQKSLFVSEGNYLIAAFYRDTLGEWKQLGSSTFESVVKVPAKGAINDLKMYKTPMQTSVSPISQKAPFSVSCTIANFGTNALDGTLRMSLFKLDGSFVADLEIKNDQSLKGRTYYSYVFKTAGLDVPVGSYFLAPSFKSGNETSYYYLAAYKDTLDTYPNLIRAIVVPPALVSDRFEPNDKDTQAATLPLSFTNNVATTTTEGSNLHVVSDLDYYKLDLPTGYSYELTARVHDRDTPVVNGKTYGADVIFSYKVGNGTYSRVNDVSVNDINDKIKLTNGGTVLFKLAPISAGEKGSYLLDIQVSRQQIAQPSIVITSPKSGDKWLTTSKQQITWTDNIAENVRIDLLQGINNTIVRSITASTPSNGQFSWTVPETLPEAADYKIGIMSVTTSTIQAVSGQFSIAAPVLPAQEEDVQLIIYPNPTAGLLTVQVPHRLQFRSVNVTNVLGQKVLTLDNRQATDELTIDLSHYPTGIYYVQLTGDGEPVTRKISLIK